MPTDAIKINDVDSRQGLLPDDGWMWLYPGGKSEIIYMHFTHANTLTFIFPTLEKLAIPGFRPYFWHQLVNLTSCLTPCKMFDCKE